MKTQRCPVCGSKKLETRVSKNLLPIPYGEPVEYEERFDHCLECGEYGDYSGENDKTISRIIDQAKRCSVPTMLDELVSKGYKLAYVERALDLPQRTTMRWKKGEVSASCVALMRTIVTYPWMLEVADSNYNPIFAKSKLCEEAVKCLHEALMIRTQEASVNLVLDPSQLHFSADYTFLPQIKIEEMQ